jgi:hypothetical protein
MGRLRRRTCAAQARAEPDVTTRPYGKMGDPMADPRYTSHIRKFNNCVDAERYAAFLAKRLPKWKVQIEPGKNNTIVVRALEPRS